MASSNDATAPSADFACLQDRVRKHSLPVVVGPPGPDAPTLKRLLLPQGELAQLHDDLPAIHYLAIVELREGMVRGNHFHKIKEEHIYVLSGEAWLEVEDPQSHEHARVPLRTGDLVFIAPGVAHTVRVIKSGQAIEYSPARFNAADIHRYVIAERA